MSSCNKEEALKPVEQKTAEMTYRGGDCDGVAKDDDSEEEDGITVTGEEDEDESDNTGGITVTGGEGEDDSDDKGGITTTGDEDEEEETGKKGTKSGSLDEDK